MHPQERICREGRGPEPNRLRRHGTFLVMLEHRRVKVATRRGVKAVSDNFVAVIDAGQGDTQKVQVVGGGSDMIEGAEMIKPVRQNLPPERSLGEATELDHGSGPSPKVGGQPPGR